MYEKVFDELVDAHYASLSRFALSLTRRPADACDLTQQTFLIWATKGDTLRDRTKAKTRLSRLCIGSSYVNGVVTSEFRRSQMCRPS